MALFSKKNHTRNPKIEQGRRAPVTSYYRSETPGDSPSPFKRKAPKKNHRKYIFGFLDIILLILIVFGVGYSLAVKSQPKIIASNTFFHSSSEYQAIAATQFSQFKNRNKITFDELGVASILQKKFPEINSVQIELPFFSEQATLRLAVAQPSFELVNQGQSYIVASNGIVVAKSAKLPDIKGLQVVNDQSGFNAKIGHLVLSASQTGFIESVISQCQHAKIPISSLVLPTTPEEMDLQTSDQPYYVKFYLGGNALEETGQYIAARQHFKQINQPPSQYLDVRIPGKIFYK